MHRDFPHATVPRHTQYVEQTCIGTNHAKSINSIVAKCENVLVQSL